MFGAIAPGSLTSSDIKSGIIESGKNIVISPREGESIQHEFQQLNMAFYEREKKPLTNNVN